jgi:hypothetical protein
VNPLRRTEARVSSPTQQEESRNGAVRALGRHAASTPSPLAAYPFDPEKELSAGLEEHLCEVLCNLAQVDFAGFFPVFFDDNGKRISPKRLLFTSRRTKSTYCLTVHEVSLGGAEAIRAHAKTHDALFEQFTASSNGEAA